MKTFKVTIPIVGYRTYQLKAKDEEEIKEIFLETGIDNEHIIILEDTENYDLDTNNWIFEEIDS